MAKGNNKYGSAGRAGVPAATVVAFLDHYTYEGHSLGGRRAKRINGRPIDGAVGRSIRRWRSGAVDRVSPAALVQVLIAFGFDIAWFHAWCRTHRKPIK